MAEMLRFGHKLNHRWDQESAQQRLEKLQIPLTQRIRELSGGQRAQVSLALALGKKPGVLGREAIAEMKGREMGVEPIEEGFGLATPAVP